MTCEVHENNRCDSLDVKLKSEICDKNCIVSTSVQLTININYSLKSR